MDVEMSPKRQIFELTEMDRAREAPGRWRHMPEICRKSMQRDQSD